VKGILVHVIGAVVTFVVAVVFMLLLNGMLSAKPPFIVGHGSPAADSTTVQTAPGEPAERHGSAEPAEGHSSAEPAAADTAAVSSSESTVLAASGPLIDTGLRNLPLGADEPASEEALAQYESYPGADTPAEDASAVPPDTQKLARMVRVYEKMRPKQVAQVFGSLPDDQTVAMLSKMNDRAAAKVIAAMEPTNAARLSQMMVRTGMP
jgi:hypothetical protein